MAEYICDRYKSIENEIPERGHTVKSSFLLQKGIKFLAHFYESFSSIILPYLFLFHGIIPDIPLWCQRKKGHLIYYFLFFLLVINSLFEA